MQNMNEQEVIRLNHWVSVLTFVEILMSILMPDKKGEVINIDWGPQQALNTENLWLNVIITHS